MRLLISLFAALFLVHTAASQALAAHPLITDDTGTQGRGKSQLELDGQHKHESRDGVRKTEIEIMPMVSYGMTDSIDIVVGVPYEFMRTRQSGETTGERGFSDLSLEVKWRFYEKDGLSFAVKPGMTLPTGNDDKGLGTGKVTYSFFFIATKDLKPWAFHVNLGYSRNENTQDARKDLWHASLASEYQLAENLRLVGNIGIERGDDPVSRYDPAFLLGGLIYSLTENVDVDAGYKYGLTRSDADHTILAGITYRF